MPSVTRLARSGPSGAGCNAAGVLNVQIARSAAPTNPHREPSV